MATNKESFYSLFDIIRYLKLFSNHLLKKWLSFILVALIGAGIGSLYSLVQKPKYEAVTTFILEEKSAGGGGLAGLASQFGFNLGGLTGGGNIFSGDNILDILKSKKIVQKVLVTKLGDPSNGNKTLADLYVDFAGLKKKWEKKPFLADIEFGKVQLHSNPVYDSVLNIIYEGVIKKNLVTQRINKQATIIKVQITAPDRMFAKLMAERLVEEASKLFLDLRIGTAQENIKQLQRRSDSLLILLNNKSYRAAASQPLDINPGIRTAIVPVEIANRDKTVIATLYAEVTKNLEASKLLLSQQTPVIQLLDTPDILLEDKSLKLFVAIAGSVFVVIMLFVIFQFLVFLNKQNQLSNSAN